MLTAKKVKRAIVNSMTEIARRRSSCGLGEKALLCCAAKKSPYIYPIQEPIATETMIIIVFF